MSFWSRLVDKAEDRVSNDSKAATLWGVTVLSSVFAVAIFIGPFFEEVAFISAPPPLTIVSGTAISCEVQTIRLSGRRGRWGGSDTYVFVTIDQPLPNGFRFRREETAEGYEALRNAACARRTITFHSYENYCAVGACSPVSASVDGLVLFDDGLKKQNVRVAFLGSIIVLALACITFSFSLLRRLTGM